MDFHISVTMRALAFLWVCVACVGEGLSERSACAARVKDRDTHLASKDKRGRDLDTPSHALATWKQRRSSEQVQTPSVKVQAPSVQAQAIDSLRVASLLLLALNKNAMITEEMKPCMPCQETASRKKRSGKKKVLIIMSDTGGGHKASGLAIASALQELYPGKIEIKIVDMLACNCEYPFKASAVAYRYVAKHPILWKMLYEYSRFPLTCFLSQRVAVQNCWKGFIKYFSKEAPDMIISVHPLMQHLPLRVINSMYGGAANRRKHVPFVTVVTDLGGGHPLWLCKQIDKTYVPSDFFEKWARNKGISRSKLRKFGLPIRPGFKPRTNKEKDSLRYKLGLHRGIRTAVLVGGGDGIGKIDTIAIEVARELGADGGGPAQLVVICGKNHKLKAKLEAETWPQNVHVSVQGFVRDMDQWMGTADCIITKAGPGTISEACATGLPIMLSDFLPGQEAPNVRYVVKGGFGAFSKRPKTIARTVSRWLTNPKLLAHLSNNARKAGKPEATKKIAKDMAELLFRDG